MVLTITTTTIIHIIKKKITKILIIILIITTTINMLTMKNQYNKSTFSMFLNQNMEINLEFLNLLNINLTESIIYLIKVKKIFFQ
jgi:hypothetical protein